MAFTNPNLITSGVSKEEFEDLKKIVNDIALDVSKLKQGNVIDENIFINDNQINKTGYVVSDKNITVAKLLGVPRIDYFNFNNKETNIEKFIEQPTMNEEPVNLNDINNIETNINNNDSVVDTIVDLKDIISEPKAYIINKKDLPNIVKTNSSHRTITMGENKVVNMKNSYYNSLIKTA